ncbi:hypothetical protein K458DRAFT_127171 [Lentithecium fluviatile CBS 122367]|uniref:Uncharacterized protein n=1 Tax=Lentithecium fluviatile CBS 122367 TaxID=1168545 RepID=A0A6G1JGN0_9PLEO|nr:hypothetical protein K458DRAFT_127171 [Lentithecium fluviatile CBS 122367]
MLSVWIPKHWLRFLLSPKRPMPSADGRSSIGSPSSCSSSLSSVSPHHPPPCVRELKSHILRTSNPSTRFAHILTRTSTLLPKTRTRLHHLQTTNHYLSAQTFALKSALAEQDKRIGLQEGLLRSRERELEEARRAYENLKQDTSAMVEEFRAALRCIDGLEEVRKRLVKEVKGKEA